MIKERLSYKGWEIAVQTSSAKLRISSASRLGRGIEKTQYDYAAACLQPWLPRETSVVNFNRA